MTAYRIERGTAAQAPRLREIERAAGDRFREIGMGDVADGDVTPAAILEAPRTAANSTSPSTSAESWPAS